MGNEQAGGTNDHSPTNKNKEHRRESISWATKIPLTNPKSSWHTARDISMDILSRKNTKLTFKKGLPSNINTSRSVSRLYPSGGTSTVSEPFHIHRIPRMPTENEASATMISYDTSCSFCEDTCTSDYIRCRICPKSYHLKCLFQHGYIRNLSIQIPRFGKPDWTCPECSDLTRLLNEDELHYLIEAFEHIDRNKDGYIVLDEFLSLQATPNTPFGFELFIQYNADVGRRLFSLIDTSRKGVIAWTDFALFYSCKLMVVKNQIELTTKLSEKELVMARKLFLKDPRKTFDDNFNILITKEYFTQIYHEQIQSLKRKYGSEFINTIFGDDCEHTEPLKKASEIDWSEYLRRISLVILLNRSNDKKIGNQSRRASIPRHLSNASIISLTRFSPREFHSSSRLALSRSITPTAIAVRTPSCDDVFIKHAKILEKLNRKTEEEQTKKKQMGSLINFTIVENVDEENIPRLQLNRRDDRRVITDPWTSAKEIGQLRNEPIAILRTTYRCR